MTDSKLTRIAYWELLGAWARDVYQLAETNATAIASTTKTSRTHVVSIT